MSNENKKITPAQAAACEAYVRHGSYAAAAAELKVSKGTVFNHVKRVEAMEAGIEAANDNAKRVSRTTTLRRGKPGSDVVLEWERVDHDKADSEAKMRAFMDALVKEIEPIKPVPFEQASSMPVDLLTVYLIGDHHLGMLAWGEETDDDDYDLKISTKLLRDVMGYLTGTVPPTKEALIVFMGDFMHTDGYVPVTPENKHPLDGDTRYPKIADAAALLMRHVIDAALTRHEHVRVIVVAGNHDPVSMVWARIALRGVYEKNRRVEIDRDVSERHYVQFGRNAIGLTHGHRAKLGNLPILMATERPEMWAQTAYRYWYTGHVHHDQVKDLTGAKVESVRVLPPPDAYTAREGYRTPRDMKAIILDRRFGERGRFIAPAEMFAQEEEERKEAA